MRRDAGDRMRTAWAIVLIASLSFVSLKAADAVKGKANFVRCAACHTLRAELKNVLGPTLESVFGRRAGSREDYRYSPAMRRSAIIWTADTIAAYLADPQGYIRNNRMPFEGIKDAAERADLIAYLEQATRIDPARP